MYESVCAACREGVSRADTRASIIKVSVRMEQVSNHELSPPVWEDLKNDVLAIADKWFPLQQVRMVVEVSLACVY